MKILIDIGHPSHVHYFKNFYKIMIERNHEILVTARDKEITLKLLDAYNIPYINRGKGGKGFLGKLFYMLYADFKILKIAKKFKPDIFLSCASPYAAQVSCILRKPHISIDDTDIANLGHKFYVPFTKCVISPVGFKKNFGKKHIFINSTFDLFYLHPTIFKPDLKKIKEINLDKKKKTVFVRFTSMDANHDWSHDKVGFTGKKRLIDNLKQNYNVVISSESALPKDLEQFLVKLNPEDVHDLLYYADLFIGESGSMATEAAILGTPSICLASGALGVGVFEIFTKSHLFHIIPDIDIALEKALHILKSDDNRDYLGLRDSLISEMINPTTFLVMFVEQFPKSMHTCLSKPNLYNNNFS